MTAWLTGADGNESRRMFKNLHFCVVANTMKTDRYNVPAHHGIFSLESGVDQVSPSLARNVILERALLES